MLDYDDLDARLDAVAQGLDDQAQRLQALEDGHQGPAAPEGSGADENPEPVGKFPAAAPWAGQTVEIAKLAGFTERHGLRVVRGEWPKGAACPVLYVAEVDGGFIT